MADLVVDNQIQQCLKHPSEKCISSPMPKRKPRRTAIDLQPHSAASSIPRLSPTARLEGSFFRRLHGGKCEIQLGSSAFELSSNFNSAAILGSRTRLRFQYISIDRVHFTSPIAGRGNRNRFRASPPVIFSEVMRDVDLFVGVCSVGNDPNLQDRAPSPISCVTGKAFAAELYESGKSRHAVLHSALPSNETLKLPLALGQVLEVKAKSTHTGFTWEHNIQIVSNNQYLCTFPRVGRTS